MIKKNVLFLVSFLMVFLSGCPEGGQTDFSANPDPTGVVVPAAAEELYIVTNVGGKIVGFQSSAPADFITLAEDASIDERYAEIRISPDLKYLLYARVTGTKEDLVLLNLELPVSETNPAVIELDVESNESEFIDNTSLFYSDGGNIFVYNIETASVHKIVPHQEERCNHWAQISPDLTRIVFKDQNPIPLIQEGFKHAWSPVVLGEESDQCNEFLEYYNPQYPVNLYDSFYYNWRDNERILFKNLPGLTTQVYEKNIVTGIALTNATIQSDGTVVNFGKMLISPDKEDLLLYGDKGLYRLNLVTNNEITGTIEVDAVYSQPSLSDTKYAAFGSGSLSFVVGTSNWMGIYNTEDLARVDVSLDNIIGEEGILYALHCQ